MKMLSSLKMAQQKLINSHAISGVAILTVDDKIEDQNLIPKWYADDEKVAGDLESLGIVLYELNELGGAFGYNVIKCHPIIEQEFLLQEVNNFFGMRF